MNHPKMQWLKFSTLFFFVVLVVLGLELKALCLLERCSNLSHPPALHWLKIKHKHSLSLEILYLWRFFLLTGSSSTDLLGGSLMLL
jgi:hypothetical protein